MCREDIYKMFFKSIAYCKFGISSMVSTLFSHNFHINKFLKILSLYLDFLIKIAALVVFVCKLYLLFI